MDAQLRDLKASPPDEWTVTNSLSAVWQKDAVEYFYSLFRKFESEQGIPVLYVQHSSTSVLLNDANALVTKVLVPQGVTLFLSVLFAWCMPMWRKFVQGGALFPKAFFWPMILNALVTALPLYWLLSTYENERVRLQLIDNALTTMHERTRKEKGGDDSEIWHDPFCLYESSTTRPYNKESKESMGEWARRYDQLSNNVREWSQSEDYVRYFCATARITAQAVLAAGTILMIFLLAVTVQQAMSGKGMLDFDKGKLGSLVHKDTASALAAAKHAGNTALHAAQAQIETTRSAFESAVHNATASAHSAAESAQHATASARSAAKSARHAAASERASADSALHAAAAALHNVTNEVHHASSAAHSATTTAHNATPASDNSSDNASLRHLTSLTLIGAGQAAVTLQASTLGRGLREALAIFEQHLWAPLQWQVEALVFEHEAAFPEYSRRLLEADDVKGGIRHAGKYLSAMQGVNVTKITKTQVAALSMILLITIYSIYLIVVIAKINYAFDIHDQMLTHQKQHHAQSHAVRMKNSILTQSTNEIEQVSVREDEEEEEFDQAKVARETLEQQKQADKKSVRRFYLAQSVQAAKDSQQSYEQLLDTTIDNSAKKYSRYPIKLFGITITKAVVLGYVGFALLPFAHQAQALAPAIAKKACDSLEDLPIITLIDTKLADSRTAVNEALDKAQHAAQDVADQAEVGGLVHAASRILHGHGEKRDNKERRKDNSAGARTEGPELPTIPNAPKVSIKKAIHTAICKPLVQAVETKAKEIVHKVEKASEAAEKNGHDADDGRRLSPSSLGRGLGQALDAAVAEWLTGSLEDQEVRRAHLEQALHELSGRAHQLLRLAPVAVHSAYALGGLDAALDVVLLHQELRQTPARAAGCAEGRHTNGDDADFMDDGFEDVVV